MQDSDLSVLAYLKKYDGTYLKKYDGTSRDTPLAVWSNTPLKQRKLIMGVITDALKCALSRVARVEEIRFDPDALAQRLDVELFGYYPVPSDTKTESSSVSLNASIESLAEIVYDAFPFTETGNKPPWTIRGNSIKQDEARAIAKSIINGYTTSK